MKINHYDMEEELPDEWWIAAGMSTFVRSAASYRCDHAAAEGRRVCLIPIPYIGPVRRASGVPVFNADAEDRISARERVERILRAFVGDDALPPIQLTKHAGRYPYCLNAGAHRLYCSIAAGFTQIPAIKFIDIKALDAGQDIEELC